MKPTSSLTSSGGSSGKTNSKRENSRTSVAAMKTVLTPPAASLLRKAKITSKAPKEKALTPPLASILPRTSVTRVAVSKARNNMGTVQQTEASRRHQKLIDKAESKKVGVEMVQEKTLHIIEGKTDCKSSRSAQNKSQVIQFPAPVSRASLKSSFYANSHTSHPNGVPGRCIKDYPTRKLSSEEESSASVKLKFRRGKVVEPQSETGPLERLRFRQAGVLADSRGASGNSRRRSFRRRGADGGIISVAKLAAVKVVLRHQNVQGKKDGRVLLNNVIEETASKLVETRKSKVKALVGAFESVISLQEGRQSVERPPTETTIS
ncbi:hypothetical protein Nepgr_020724 [Nepenthes gracilis]|uniref:Calmodulin-binding domain-containing protein n=1 Tax=Nepenthes gracilis TaxID=150966 RepID=A0AAD3XVH1_NEPGR|nr:hypothetical protein Nepgr_020724 [Nepenthes gracilis]